MHGPRLAGERVTLAPPISQYVDDYRRWFEDPVVTRFVLLRYPDLAQVVLVDRANAADTVFWAILVDGRHIGYTFISRIDWRSRHAETVTVIGERECWGRGYATEVMRLRTAYAFNELGLETLVTFVVQPNEASRRALLRTGYREVGWLRRHFYAEGSFHNMWVGELLREEWARMMTDSGAPGEGVTP